MVAVKILTIEEKLYRLQLNVDFIEDILKERSDQKILDDRRTYYSLQHMLLLSIELILDAGNHILSEKFSEKPGKYAEIITLLGRRKVIKEDFAESQKEMASFRNLLAHEYASLDENKIVQYAREAPAIFMQFKKYFSDFIEHNK